MSDAITLTKQGIVAHKAGDIPGATRLLVQAVQTDPAYEMAWLWLASCMPTAGEKRYCLDQALRASPASAPARTGLAQLGDARSVMPAALADAPLAPPKEFMGAAKVANKDLPGPLIFLIASIFVGLVWFGNTYLNPLTRQPTAPAVRPTAAPIGYGVIVGYDLSTEKKHISEITMHSAPAGTPCSPCRSLGYAHEGDRVAILEQRADGTIKVRTPAGIEGWTQIDFVNVE